MSVRLPNRPRAKKLLDAADFTLTIEHNRNAINHKRLREYGELVYRGGGDDLLKLAADVVGGRTLVF